MRTAAQLAAHAAADATAALLLHDDEGHFGDLDVECRLAEALTHTIDLRLGQLESCDDGYRAALLKLQAEAQRFIKAWAG